MKVTARWEKDLVFEGRSEDGKGFYMDSRLSDDQKGATPMQSLLLSLAGCTGMDVMWVLNKKKVKVDGFTVEVSAQQAEEYPQVYTSIHMRYILVGDDIPPDAAERAVKLSNERYCPIIAMLSKDAEITHEIEIKQRE